MKKEDVKLSTLLIGHQEPVEAHGAIQGRIHSVFIGADPPHFADVVLAYRPKSKQKKAKKRKKANRAKRG